MGCKESNQTNKTKSVRKNDRIKEYSVKKDVQEFKSKLKTGFVVLDHGVVK